MNAEQGDAARRALYEIQLTNQLLEDALRRYYDTDECTCTVADDTILLCPFCEAADALGLDVPLADRSTDAQGWLNMQSTD